MSSIFWRIDKNALATDIRGAAANGDAPRLAQLLRKAKIKYLSIGDENNNTAIITASSNGHVEVVKLLIDAGAFINAMNKWNQTGLMWASHFGRVEVVKLLIAAGADVHLKNVDGWPAFISAALMGHAEVVVMLMNAGVDVNVLTNWNQTALMWASHNGHVEVSKLLIAAGADVHLKNVDGWPAFISAAHNGHAEVVVLLMNAGVDLNVLTNRNETALMWASHFGRVEVVKLLIAAGADVHLLNVDGSPAVLSACYGGHIEVLKLLMAQRADIHVQNKSEESSLMWASHFGHIAVVKLLLAAGANVQLHNAWGWPALMSAASQGHLATVKVLVAAGADILVQNKEGKSAIDVATTEEIKQYLQAVVSVPQLAECERILQQVGDAPLRRDLHERSRTLQAQREAAQAAEDFEIVASLGEALKALQRESAYLPLSEEDYLTLPARHAELVQRVTDVCMELSASAEYEKLQRLAKKLDELKVPDVLSVLTAVASDTALPVQQGRAAVGKQVQSAAGLVTDSGDSLSTLSDHLLAEIASLPQCRDTIQRVAALRAEVEAAHAAQDFHGVASLGLSLKALQLESAQLPLSEEAYRALPCRHAALVERVRGKCKELAAAQEYTALAVLSAKLKALQAVASELNYGGSTEEDSAQDPVLPADGAIVPAY